MAATTVPTAIAQPQQTKKRVSKLGRYKARWGMLFISPWVIGFLIFTIAPMIASLYFTTLDFNLATPDEAKFVGLANWQRALFQDPEVPLSFLKTAKLAVIMIPLGMLFSLFLALLLNSPHVFGKNLYRTLFYAPFLIPGAATTLIWLGVFNENTGWINLLIQNVTGLQVAGPQGLRWQADPGLINQMYAIMALWGVGNTMLINIAGLQSVPTEMYEAAEIDGASWIQRLIRITLPMISPVLFYNMVIATIGLMQYFLVPYVMNGGSGAPQGATRYIMVYFYKQTFNFLSMGYGATLAWLIFIVALALTILLFGTARYWVHYASDEG